ncbi:hypothetical protein STEG23_007055, partial [Scotinomys teguina]
QANLWKLCKDSAKDCLSGVLKGSRKLGWKQGTSEQNFGMTLMTCMLASPPGESVAKPFSLNTVIPDQRSTGRSGEIARPPTGLSFDLSPPLAPSTRRPHPPSELSSKACTLGPVY